MVDANHQNRELSNKTNSLDSFISKISGFKTPAFIVLCVILGGTSQEIYTPKIVLYLLSSFIIGIHVFKFPLRDLFVQAKFIFSLMALMIIFCVFQLIPLAPSLWSSLPGRDFYAQSYDLMQISRPWLPLAMVPGDVLKSCLSLLPAIAAFLLITRSADWNERILTIWAIPFAAVLSLLLGVAQILSENKGLYIYEVTNEGAAVGIFSNINHQANLLALGLVFSLTLAVTSRLTQARRTDMPGIGFIVGCVMSVLLVVGLLFNGSSAGYVLVILGIVLTGLSFLNIENKSNVRWIALAGFSFITIIIVDFFYLGTAQKNFSHSLLDDANTSRRNLFNSSWEIIKDTFPFGIGLGSFREVYPKFEDVNAVTGIYANHAHSDFLEFVMEMGVVGVALIIGWFLWLISAVKSFIKNDSLTAQFAKMAAIALILIVIHSGVDYPLRTLTISAIAGLCMGFVHVGQTEQDL